MSGVLVPLTATALSAAAMWFCCVRPARRHLNSTPRATCRPSGSSSRLLRGRQVTLRLGPLFPPATENQQAGWEPTQLRPDGSTQDTIVRSTAR